MGEIAEESDDFTCLRTLVIMEMHRRAPSPEPELNSKPTSHNQGLTYSSKIMSHNQETHTVSVMPDSTVVALFEFLQECNMLDFSPFLKIFHDL